ncbi:hypothetical protein Zmor_010696 [Zophobas morio]|uniref:Uncharacterized protein n=1 Tax=Zophobas morio TaxID=2755281 RepID=A0AA38MJW7_9CUCU|nr:hypothetical protein Zmor_010696 [Zophobas morio]
MRRRRDGGVAHDRRSNRVLSTTAVSCSKLPDFAQIECAVTYVQGRNRGFSEARTPDTDRLALLKNLTKAATVCFVLSFDKIGCIFADDIGVTH